MWSVGVNTSQFTRLKERVMTEWDTSRTSLSPVLCV